jgi:MOSC domain-containing protein YiiM
MPARAQLDLPADPEVMKVIAREAERCLGVYASVRRAGRVALGDRVEIERARDNPLARRMDRLGTAAKRGALRLLERLLPER